MYLREGLKVSADSSFSVLSLCSGQCPVTYMVRCWNRDVHFLNENIKIWRC